MDNRVCHHCSLVLKDLYFVKRRFCSRLCQQANWYLLNKSKVKESKKRHYIENREKDMKRIEQWQKENKEKVKGYQKKYKAKTPLTIKEKIKHSLRTRLNDVLRGRTKTGSAIKDLGCTVNELQAHLQSKFQPDMTWENYGRNGWHIDHIKPLCEFDLTIKEQLLKACHFTNLQPLWWQDNLAKRFKKDIK